MIKPIVNDDTNATFIAEGFGDLPGALVYDENGIPCVVTAWEISPEDLKKLGNAPDEDRDLILDVMNLPEKYRQVLLLVFWQGMTIREAAACMSTSESTVCRRLEKAKKMIA